MFLVSLCFRDLFSSYFRDMANVKKTCKGCSSTVQKPVICPSCGISSHPGRRCLERSGHPWANGRLIDCNANPSSTAPFVVARGHASSLNVSPQDDNYIRSEFRRLSELITDQICDLKVDYKTEIESLHKVISSLLVRINDLESKISADSPSDNNVILMEDTIAEIEDRRKRAKNLMIFNVDENVEERSSSRAVDGDKHEDLVRVSNVFSDVIADDNDIVHVRRIGRRIAGKMRPICVTLRSEDIVLNILKNKHSFPSNVNISRDQTEQQRNYLRKLRKDLSEANDPGLTIRFVNGKPTITRSSVSSHQSKNDVPRSLFTTKT